MGRTARIGLFLLMGLVIALARLIEVEVGKARPAESPPLVVPAADASAKPTAKSSRKINGHGVKSHEKSAPAKAPASTPAPAAPNAAAAIGAPTTAAPAEETSGAEWPKGPIYTVKKGETLADIALKTLGSSHKWQKLLDANAARVPNAKAVKPGTKLVIPR